MTTTRSILALLIVTSTLSAAPAIAAEEQPSSDCNFSLMALFGGFDWGKVDPNRNCGRSTYTPPESLASPGGDSTPTMATAVNLPGQVMRQPNPDQFKVIPDPDRIQDLSEDRHRNLLN